MRGVALAAVTLLLLGGCALWGPEGGPGRAGVASPTATEAAAEAVLGTDHMQRIEVMIRDDLSFTPAVVRARPGTIEFVFRNEGGTPHDVRFTESTATPGTGNLNGGQSQSVRVTAQKAGRYPFPCLYHLSSGMQGTLLVA